MIPPCTDGSIRFRNESYIYDSNSDVEVFSAQVEVCVDGNYVAVCDSGFTMAAAELACRYQSFNYQPPYYRKLIWMA